MSVLGGLACKKNEHLCIILMNYGRKLSKITSICKKNKVFCSLLENLLNSKKSSTFARFFVLICGESPNLK